MRVLSETKDDGRVIELTHEEWKEFCVLAGAVEGLTENDLAHRRMMTDRFLNFGDIVPFEGVFGSVKAFYLAKFKINEMENVLNQFKDAMRPDGKNE